MEGVSQQKKNEDRTSSNWEGAWHGLHLENRVVRQLRSCESPMHLPIHFFQGKRGKLRSDKPLSEAGNPKSHVLIKIHDIQLNNDLIVEQVLHEVLLIQYSLLNQACSVC
jgi:hypothetical protein